MAAEQLSCHITSAIAAIEHGPAPAQLHITRCQRLHFSVSPSFGPICTLLQSWMASLTAKLPVELQSNFCIVPVWQAADTDIGDSDGTLGKCCIWAVTWKYICAGPRKAPPTILNKVCSFYGNICMEYWFVCFFNSYLGYSVQNVQRNPMLK